MIAHILRTLSESERVTLCEIGSYGRFHSAPAYYAPTCSGMIVRDLTNIERAGLAGIVTNKDGSREVCLTQLGQDVYNRIRESHS